MSYETVEALPQMVRSNDSRETIYRQITNLFYQMFIIGKLSPGERLPTIQETATQLQVSVNTVLRSYKVMTDEAIVICRQKNGHFLTEDKGIIQSLANRLAQEATERFIQEMRDIGYSDTQIIAHLTRSIGIQHDMENEANLKQLYLSGAMSYKAATQALRKNHTRKDAKALISSWEQ